MNAKAYRVKRKFNKFFNYLSALFLVLSFVNLVVVVFSTFFISVDDSFVVFNGVANVLAVFQVIILGVVIISYGVNHVLEVFKESGKVEK